MAPKFRKVLKSSKGQATPHVGDERNPANAPTLGLGSLGQDQRDLLRSPGEAQEARFKDIGTLPCSIRGWGIAASAARFSFQVSVQALKPMFSQASVDAIQRKCLAEALHRHRGHDKRWRSIQSSLLRSTGSADSSVSELGIIQRSPCLNSRISARVCVCVCVCVLNGRGEIARRAQSLGMQSGREQMPEKDTCQVVAPGCSMPEEDCHVKSGDPTKGYGAKILGDLAEKQKPAAACVKPHMPQDVLIALPDA